MSKTGQETAMKVHGNKFGPVVFYSGRSVVRAKDTGRWIEIWDPVDVRENQ